MQSKSLVDYHSIAMELHFLAERVAELESARKEYESAIRKAWIWLPEGLLQLDGECTYEATLAELQRLSAVTHDSNAAKRLFVVAAESLRELISALDNIAGRGE